MKEASGDLNLTVVVVLLVALLSLFFFTVIWPRIRLDFARTTKCDEAICECERDDTGKCVIPEDGLVECHLKERPEEKIYCNWKG